MLEAQRDDVRRSLATLFTPGDVFELRAFNVQRKASWRPATEFGFFDDFETAAYAVTGSPWTLTPSVPQASPQRPLRKPLPVTSCAVSSNGSNAWGGLIQSLEIRATGTTSFTELTGQPKTRTSYPSAWRRSPYGPTQTW